MDKTRVKVRPARKTLVLITSQSPSNNFIF